MQAHGCISPDELGVDPQHQGCALHPGFGSIPASQGEAAGPDPLFGRRLILWRWSSIGQYSTTTAYQAMFNMQSAILGAKEI
jgi:hypothetical protein